MTTIPTSFVVYCCWRLLNVHLCDWDYGACLYSVASVCLSVCLCVCLSNDNFRKPSRMKLGIRCISSEYGSRSYIKVIGSRARSHQKKGRRWLFINHLQSAIFTALHGMQTQSCDELSVRPSVRPSVCLSVCQTRALWQNGRKLCLDFYITWKNIYPSFLRRRMVGGGGYPFYLKFWVIVTALERNRRFSIYFRS